MGRMPTVFFGHGTPMIAMWDNEVTRCWQSIVSAMPRPRAVLVVSAHWVTRGIGVTSQAHPPTIHDFGGFPRQMHEFIYPAPGDLELCDRIEGLLAPHVVHKTDIWGFDHGCWTVLMKVLPKADVPVVQLSIDATRSAQEHFELGRKLAPLRDEGVLIIGTGNIVHNLRDVIRTDTAEPRDYAERFGGLIRTAIANDDDEAVIRFEALGKDMEQALPTTEHFLPLLYVLGARHPQDEAELFCNFVQYSSIDMTTVWLGAA
mgnify:CR=1 FL=1